MKKIRSFLPTALSLVTAIMLAVSAHIDNTLDNGCYINKDGDIGIISSAGFTAEFKQSALLPDGSREYKADVKLFGMIPVKTVTAVTEERPYLIPCGTPFGIKLLTDGVIVTDFGQVNRSTDIFELSPAGKAGLQAGDIITHINGEKVTSSKQFTELVAKDKEKTEIQYTRDGVSHTATAIPEVDSEGNLKLGLWVRDSTAGIGTMTYYDAESGIFAGLGHAVCDVDTGEILPLRKGEIVPATITEVKKSTDGLPGELCGNLLSNTVTGTISKNSSCGLFGYSSLCPVSEEAMPMAFKNEAHTGRAYIITTINDAPAKRYEIEIESIDMSNRDNKNLVIKVTDNELLSQTGGIVQGMSGSPIIQDDMLIGAVTHVFINEPTKGYGIFAETMYKEAGELNSYAQRPQAA
ncbi:MAG: SpoIVB peptidase [Eubacterium sp.]|nr:SpoIVB peptidase [Eubacterium sp.]